MADTVLLRVPLPLSSTKKLAMCWFRVLWLAPILVVPAALGAQEIKNVKLAVTNPSAEARSAADVAIPIAEIKKVAPDFKPGAVIVTRSEERRVGKECRSRWGA